MAAILVELAIVLALLILNGALAMSEIAVVTARRSRLARRAEAGDPGAAAALELIGEPTQFLSTVQIGITFIGIVAGAVGGAGLAADLAGPLSGVPGIGGAAEEVSYVLVVGGITYLSLIVGELVPKQIGLGNPERVAVRVARPMRFLARFGRPVVRVLTASTNLVTGALRIGRSGDATVTDEDVQALVAQGRATGTIQPGEEEIVERVLRLGDRPVRAIMTPRPDVEWISPDEEPAAVRRLLIDGRHPQLLVSGATVDDVHGVVHARDLLAQLAAGRPLDVRAALRQPFFVPETTPVLRVLEMFRRGGVGTAVVLDEFGGVQGVATMADIVEDLVGELPGLAPGGHEPDIVERPEGGWLVEGSAPVETMEEELGLVRPDEERERDYQTVAGLVLTQLGHLPHVGEAVEAMGFRFEVVDMDGRRIDRLLVTRVEPPPAGSADEA